jgi:hypothetical protein
MALATSTMAAISIGISAFSAVSGIMAADKQEDAQNEARQQQEAATAEQRKARDEQKAAQAAQSAAERRTQIREERVKRARLLQSGVNSGVTGSSGEAGASGGLSTQLGTNIGFNLGQGQAASNISDAGQNAADFLSSARSHTVDANQWGSIGALSMNIFEKSGGFNSIFKGSTQAPAPVSSASPTPVYHFDP